MAIIDVKYRNLLRHIHHDGFSYEDPNRKGVYRMQIEDYTFKHDLFNANFPAITTKKLAWKSVVGELLWFLRGDTNIRYLVQNGINIWNKDAYNYAKSIGYTGSMEEFIEGVKRGDRHRYLPLGQLGRVYGAQWRSFGKNNAAGEVDQIQQAIDKLINNPMATDNIVTAWNPNENPKLALKPCHFGFQLLGRPLEKGHHGFTLKWQQRSTDVFLGLPFNIASYALLSIILGKLTNTTPLGISGSLSNVHIYDNALHASNAQIARDPLKYKAPTVKLSDNAKHLFEYYHKPKLNNPLYKNIDEVFNRLKIDDFILENYESYPGIKVDMLAYNN